VRLETAPTAPGIAPPQRRFPPRQRHFTIHTSPFTLHNSLFITLPNPLTPSPAAPPPHGAGARPAPHARSARPANAAPARRCAPAARPHPRGDRPGQVERAATWAMESAPTGSFGHNRITTNRAKQRIPDGLLRQTPSNLAAHIGDDDAVAQEPHPDISRAIDAYESPISGDRVAVPRGQPPVSILGQIAACATRRVPGGQRPRPTGSDPQCQAGVYRPIQVDYAKTPEPAPASPDCHHIIRQLQPAQSLS
jgi:hypothetical protein